VTFSVKPGVDLSDVHPAMVTAWPTIMQVFRRFGSDTTLTSGRDGKHMDGSFHYTMPMRANDFRTWVDDHGTQMRDITKHAIALDLQSQLGDDYQVIVERTHIHIEFIG